MVAELLKVLARGQVVWNPTGSPWRERFEVLGLLIVGVSLLAIAGVIMTVLWLLDKRDSIMWGRGCLPGPPPAARDDPPVIVGHPSSDPFL